MANLNVELPCIAKVILSDNGGINYKENVQFEGLLRAHGLGFFDFGSMYHSRIDEYFDKKYPNIEGKPFSVRYDSIDRKTNFDISVRETYRVLTLLRNAISHRKSSISDKGHFVEFCYYKGNNEKSLRINFFCLKILWGIAFLVSRLSDAAVDAYHQVMISAMYNSAIKGVETINDEHGQKVFLKEHDGLGLDQFKWHSRNHVFLNFTPYKGGKVRIPKLERGIHDTRFDYYFSLDGKSFLVPDEFLRDDGSIEHGDLMKWESFNDLLKNFKPTRIYI